MKRIPIIALVLLFACNAFGAANFPGSLDSYSTKASGGVISEAHINDPQDAIEAIEAKVGIGASTPVDTSVFVGTGVGTSGWMLSTPIVQIVNVMSSAWASGDTNTPFDDTIPQITEGNEFMTLAITPKSATNKLKIEVVWNGTGGAGNVFTVALHQDAIANALAAVTHSVATAYQMRSISFTHYMTAGTTSAITFRVRAGDSTSTLYFNGDNSARKYGGIMASSITITEISV